MLALWRDALYTLDKMLFAIHENIKPEYLEYYNCMKRNGTAFKMFSNMLNYVSECEDKVNISLCNIHSKMH